MFNFIACIRCSFLQLVGQFLSVWGTWLCGGGGGHRQPPPPRGSLPRSVDQMLGSRGSWGLLKHPILGIEAVFMLSSLSGSLPVRGMILQNHIKWRGGKKELVSPFRGLVCVPDTLSGYPATQMTHPSTPITHKLLIQSIGLQKIWFVTSAQI